MPGLGTVAAWRALARGTSGGSSVRPGYGTRIGDLKETHDGNPWVGVAHGRKARGHGCQRGLAYMFRRRVIYFGQQ